MLHGSRDLDLLHVHVTGSIVPGSRYAVPGECWRGETIEGLLAPRGLSFQTPQPHAVVWQCPKRGIAAAVTPGPSVGRSHLVLRILIRPGRRGRCQRAHVVNGGRAVHQTGRRSRQVTGHAMAGRTGHPGTLAEQKALHDVLVLRVDGLGDGGAADVDGRVLIHGSPISVTAIHRVRVLFNDPHRRRSGIANVFLVETSPGSVAEGSI